MSSNNQPPPLPGASVPVESDGAICELIAEVVETPPRRTFTLAALSLWLVIAACLAAVAATQVRRLGRRRGEVSDLDELILEAKDFLVAPAIGGAAVGLVIALALGRGYRGGFPRTAAELGAGVVGGAAMGLLVASADSAVTALIGSVVIASAGVFLRLMATRRRR